MRALIAAGVAIVVALAAGTAQAQKRLALVIGNAEYLNVTPLQKAADDAKAYKDHFETERGFDHVFYAENADEETMVETIAGFISTIEEGDVAVVVYSGHGVQLDQNRTDSLFLLPTDIPELDGSGLSAEFRLSRSAISFSDLRTQISLRGAATRVFVLDACRDNPFSVGDDRTRSLGTTKGLLPIKTVSGEFVFFAAAPGEKALDRLHDDDPHPNSVFSRVFLQHFRKGAFLEDIANDVQKDVFDLAKTATPSFTQQPYYDDGVIGRTCIDDACGADIVTASTDTGPSATGPTVASGACEPALARELWDYARETNDCLGYDAFLEACPQSTFAAFARAGRARLGCADVATAPPAPAAPTAGMVLAPGSSEEEDEAEVGAGIGIGIASAPASPPLSDSEGRGAAAGGLSGGAVASVEPEAKPARPRMSKHEARQQVLAALAEINKAGVEGQYKELLIDETPEGIVARLVGLKMRLPDLEAEISLEEISARRDEAGGFVFTLPERIVLEELAPSEGDTETAQLIVSSSAFFAGLYRDEEGGHVLRVGAGMLRLEPPELSGESITFLDLAIDGRLATDPERGDGSLSASISMSEAVAKLEEGGEPFEMRAQGVLFKFDGDEEQAKGALAVKSAGVSGAQFGNLGLGGLRASLDAKPGDRFDLKPAMAPEATTSDVIGLIAATFYQSVLEGGHIDTSASLDLLEGRIQSGGPTDVAMLDAKGLGAKLQLNPERIGAGLEAKKFVLDQQGAAESYVSFDNIVADIGAVPGYRFDWSTVAAAPGDEEATWAMVDQIRREVAAGGRASLILTNDSYRTRTPMPPGGPFSALATGGGGSATELTIEQNTAALSMNGKTFYYESEGALAGRADVGLFSIDADFPLTASRTPQQGSGNLELRDIVLDERAWAQIDPNGVLDHEIGGISLKTVIVTTIMENLLTLSGDEVEAPLTVHRVDLENLSVDALGARVSAVGDIMIDPSPVGLVRVTISRWREMFHGLGQTPLATDPEMAGMLLAATSWIENYGEQGVNEDETILNVEFSEDGQILINGKPFEG